MIKAPYDKRVFLFICWTTFIVTLGFAAYERFYTIFCTHKTADAFMFVNNYTDDDVPNILRKAEQDCVHQSIFNGLIIVMTSLWLQLGMHFLLYKIWPSKSLMKHLLKIFTIGCVVPVACIYIIAQIYDFNYLWKHNKSIEDYVLLVIFVLIFSLIVFAPYLFFALVKLIKSNILTKRTF